MADRIGELPLSMARRPAQAPLPLLLALLAIAAGFAMLKWRSNRTLTAIDPAAITATIQQLRDLANAADHHERTTGQWPASRPHGPTPLGGHYVWQRTESQTGNQARREAAITIENATPDKVKAWQAIDQQLDDGDLTGGWVYWRDERLTWVLEDE